jgi:hypothetical protein
MVCADNLLALGCHFTVRVIFFFNAFSHTEMEEVLKKEMRLARCGGWLQPANSWLDRSVITSFEYGGGRMFRHVLCIPSRKRVLRPRVVRQAGIRGILHRLVHECGQEAAGLRWLRLDLCLSTIALLPVFPAAAAFAASKPKFRRTSSESSVILTIPPLAPFRQMTAKPSRTRTTSASLQFRPSNLQS